MFPGRPYPVRLRVLPPVVKRPVEALEEVRGQR